MPILEGVLNLKDKQKLIGSLPSKREVLSGAFSSYENLYGHYNGIRGAKGESAYDLAKQNGFSGSLQEWLESLKGKSSKVEVIEDNVDSYILAFTTEDEVIVTPNLRAVLPPEYVDYIISNLREDLDDAYQQKGDYIEAEVITNIELEELLT